MERLNENADQSIESMVIDTLLYGQVNLHYSDGEVEAAYQESPHTTVKISRVGERTHKKTPIGTRTASAVQAAIDGRTITLNPGRARLLKRSYRVGIEFDDRVLTLAAKDLEESFLLDGRSDRGDNSFGVLTRGYGGAIDVMWSLPFKFATKTVEPPTPSREDVLVGISAAAAFGTGGLSATTIVMGALGAVFP